MRQAFMSITKGLTTSRGMTLDVHHGGPLPKAHALVPMAALDQAGTVVCEPRY
jgi:hypothetical protein